MFDIQINHFNLKLHICIFNAATPVNEFKCVWLKMTDLI